MSPDRYFGTLNARIVLADDDTVRATVTALWLAQMGWGEVAVYTGGLEVGPGGGLGGGDLEAGPAADTRPAAPAAELMTPEILLSALDAGEVSVIDVGPSADFVDAHIAGAAWCLRPDVADHIRDTGRPVVLTSRDGTVAQLLPFNVVGWHAGVSAWDGREGLNRHSIGIEIDNAGQLEEKDGRYLSWFGQEYPAEEVVFGVHRNQSQETPWHRFPPAQLELVEALAELLVRHYGMRYVLGHEEIAPGRKIDPGPAFPLDALRARLLGGTGV